MRFISALKILFSVLFGMYALRGAFVQQSAWLLDGANLLFHEAGHLFFSIGGEWLGFAGGTIMQLLIPAGLAIAFFYQRQIYSASIMLLWFGQNFFGISVYIRDARAQNLPLVGGGDHDWSYLLYRVGLLEWDQHIGGFVWFLGLVIVVTAAFLGVYKTWTTPSPRAPGALK